MNNSIDFLYDETYDFITNLNKKQNESFKDISLELINVLSILVREKDYVITNIT